MVSRVCTLAVLLCLLGVGHARTNIIPGKPGLNDVLHSLGRLKNSFGPSKVGIASTYTSPESTDLGTASYPALEEKEICMTETSRKYCLMAPNPPVVDEPQNVFWTSGFSCCPEEDGYDNYGSMPGGHVRTWGTDNTIGSCDWTVVWVPGAANAPPPVNPGGVAITNNLDRLGTASAVCYYGGDASSCGGPLCDRLVMALDGILYLGAAYSYWGSADTSADTTCAASNPGVDTDFPFPRVGGDGTPIIKFANAKKHPKPTTTLKPAGAKIQYNGRFHDSLLDTNRDVYASDAVMISGIVTSTAGGHSDEWAGGCFEYVVSFADPQPVTDGLDPSLPWVRDKSYKFTFYKRSSYSS